MKGGKRGILQAMAAPGIPDPYEDSRKQIEAQKAADKARADENTRIAEEAKAFRAKEQSNRPVISVTRTKVGTTKGG